MLPIDYLRKLKEEYRLGEIWLKKRFQPAWNKIGKRSLTIMALRVEAIQLASTLGAHQNGFAVVAGQICTVWVLPNGGKICMAAEDYEFQPIPAV